MVARVEQRTVDGNLEMRPLGRRPFRRWELRDRSGTIAALGPRSWLWIYMGPGQRVTLADGTGGRIVGTGMHNWIIPVVTDDSGGTVARATPGPHSSYTIDTIDEGFRLVADTPHTWRSKPDRWELSSWGEPVATFGGHPETIETRRPVPLAAVLLGFTVMSLGIPGEHALGAPRMQW